MENKIPSLKLDLYKYRIDPVTLKLIKGEKIEIPTERQDSVGNNKNNSKVEKPAL